jgi:hypothetical protein
MAAMGAYVESSTVVLFGGWVYAKANSELDVTGPEQAKGLGWPVVPEVVMVEGQLYVLQLRFGQQPQSNFTAVPTKAEHLRQAVQLEHSDDDSLAMLALDDKSVATPRPTKAPGSKVSKVLPSKAKARAKASVAGGRQKTLAECGLAGVLPTSVVALPIGARRRKAVPQLSPAPDAPAPAAIGAPRQRKSRVVAAQKHPLRAHLGRKYSKIIGAGRLHTMG